MRLCSPEADEFNFVFDSYARSFKKSKWAGCVPNHLYDSVSRACMSEIIDRGARVVVAVEGEDGARRIVGYSITEPVKKTVHYIYVKRDLRGLGIGHRLLDEATDGDLAGWVYTHKTGACDRFFRGMLWEPQGARALSK